MRRDLQQTVVAAQSGGLSDFADLVREFQDATLGYAYAYLGDYHKAEDASQEAWLRAWVELPRLRESSAFPGWLRQVTLSCCSRFVRGRRLSVVPLDLDRQVASPEPLADERLAVSERARRVHEAIHELPALQREAVLLYYMSECSQRQAAAFLDVPETTVKKRLFDARRRLKERMIEMEEEQIAPAGDTYTRRVLDGIQSTQTSSTGWSSLICCMQPMLAAAGIEVSVPRLAGMFGHAFSFYTRREPGNAWQDENIDWQYFWQNLDLVGCRLEEVQAVGTRETAEAAQAAKDGAWQAVRASIDRGVPAMAWQPMTYEQKERGLAAYEWGLLTGYDTEQASYTVRHKAQAMAYDVPYDGFGNTDPVEWFAVMWPGESQPTSDEEVTRRSLVQAVDYAHGRWPGDSEPCFPVDALGLTAYDLFREQLADTMTVAAARIQVGLLSWARRTAADFCREMASSSGWEAQLRQAAEHYDREAGKLSTLHALCEEVTLVGGRREEARAIMTEVIVEEKAAIAVIEAVL